MAAGGRGAGKRALGALPRWDLADLYPGRDSDDLKRDLDGSAADAKSFAARYKGKLAALSGAELGAAVASFERLQETLGRVMSYGSLVHATDMSDPEIGRFYQTMHERVNDIGTELLFFVLELNRIEDASLDEKMKAPELAHYAPWLRDVRLFRPHQLADELERLLHEKSVAGRAAWTRLFDETEADLRFRIKGKSLTSAEALHLLSSTRRRDAQGGGEGAGRGLRQERAALRPHHQHARQGQGGRGPLARVQAADLVAQSRQSRRGRGGGCADLGRARRLSAPVAPLLPAQGASGSASSSCPTGTATRRFPTRTTAPSPGATRSASCSTLMAPSRPTWRRSGGASSSMPGSTRR